MIFTYLKLSMFLSSTGQNGQVKYYHLVTKILEDSVFKQVYSSTCSTKELSISMTAILHAVKGELLSYCDKVYSRGSINQKHRIGGVVVSFSRNKIILFFQYTFDSLSE
jgi:hypothetical protein